MIEDPESCTNGCVCNDSDLEIQLNSHFGHEKTIAGSENNVTGKYKSRYRTY